MANSEDRDEFGPSTYGDRIAGLRLRYRHGGWRGEPFDADSQRHVSVYERE